MPKHSAKEIVREWAYIVGGAACYGAMLFTVGLRMKKGLPIEEKVPKARRNIRG